MKTAFIFPFCYGLALSQNVITTLDTAGASVRAATILMGADGLPFIVYAMNEELRTAKCGDAACTAGNVFNVLDTSGEYIDGPISVIRGTDGFPVISYAPFSFNPPQIWLKVLKCGSLDCSTGNAVHVLDTIVGSGVSMALGTDGFPVTAYRDGFGVLKIAKCTDAACSSTPIFAAIDSVGGYEFEFSMAMGSDGFPIISYWHFPDFDLQVVKCGNASCTAGNILTRVDVAGDVGDANNISIGSDGLPVIAYSSFQSGRELLFAKCGNASCTSGNTITTVDPSVNTVWYTTLAVAMDGLPVIGYHDVRNGDLRVVKCGNAACSAGNTITTVDSAGDVGTHPSIAVGSDGRPVVAYFDNGNKDLKVLKCGDASCSQNPGAIRPYSRSSGRRNGFLFPNNDFLFSNGKSFDLRGRKNLVPNN